MTEVGVTKQDERREKNELKSWRREKERERERKRGAAAAAAEKSD